MSDDPISAKVRDLTLRHQAAMLKLRGPAQAAANALTDAGMKATAEPLKEALFEIDAIDQELRDFIHAEGDEILNRLLGRFK